MKQFAKDPRRMAAISRTENVINQSLFPPGTGYSLSVNDPTSAYLLKLAAAKVTALTDFDILPYPSILKASEIVDAVTGPLSDILVGAPLDAKLEEMQAKVEKIVAPL